MVSAMTVNVMKDCLIGLEEILQFDCERKFSLWRRSQKFILITIAGKDTSASSSSMSNNATPICGGDVGGGGDGDDDGGGDGGDDGDGDVDGGGDGDGGQSCITRRNASSN